MAQTLILYMLKGLRIFPGRSFIKMNFRILSQLASASNVLRVLGATVGTGSHISADICVYNLADFSCHNLNVGSNVYIGPRCLFDLTSKIVIEDDAAISAQVSFITHLDVGNQPLKKFMPRREGPITVRRGAWIGVNTTVLQDVIIGRFAMVGAMSLVNKEVPPRSLVMGIPCQVKRTLAGPEDGGETGPLPV